jgi:hypothetical protein
MPCGSAEGTAAWRHGLMSAVNEESSQEARVVGEEIGSDRSTTPPCPRASLTTKGIAVQDLDETVAHRSSLLSRNGLGKVLEEDEQPGMLRTSTSPRRTAAMRFGFPTAA